MVRGWIVRSHLARQGIKFKFFKRGSLPVLCCGSCLSKDRRIKDLESKVDSLQAELVLLKNQKQQHEHALRYLFEKVERLLKAEAERHLNAS
jgi:UDP-glucose 6-dehydrogenase